ncbi:hypothetical protein AB4Z29_13545 [Paenibacillus sp. 2TAB23]|uniref:hypothetical protein n=1 Tax=Paenibacillus sp. 2TAB23 TaxID=3233004 RepID=UPI003F9BC94F
MTLGQMIRNISIGLIIGIVAIGLLPFLVIFSWAEMQSLIEFETSPLFMMIGRFIGRKTSKDEPVTPDKQEANH